MIFTISYFCAQLDCHRHKYISIYSPFKSRLSKWKLQRPSPFLGTFLKSRFLFRQNFKSFIISKRDVMQRSAVYRFTADCIFVQGTFGMVPRTRFSKETYGADVYQNSLV